METLRILITGDVGFIGSHLVRALVRAGYGVRVFDNLSTGSLDNIGDVLNVVEFIKGNVKDYETVECAVEDDNAIVPYFDIR